VLALTHGAGRRSGAGGRVRRLSVPCAMVAGCTFGPATIDQRVFACASDGDCIEGYRCLNAVCSMGGSAGGSTAGGSTAGGATAGGATAGGATAGGATAGGSTAGGATAGGSTAGGSTAGGATAGGATAGGATAGGATAGGAPVCVVDAGISAVGLAGFWKFDEPSGSTVIDHSGSGSPGSISGTWSRAPGVIGSAVISSDGGFGSIDFGSAPALNPQGPFSFSLWAKTSALDSVSQQAFVTKGIHPTAGWELLDDGQHNAIVLFRVYPANFPRASVPRADVNDGSWHHYAGVFDGGSVALYLDGAWRDDDATSNFVAATANALRLRSYGQKELAFDQLRFYGRALTPAEVAALFKEPAALQACDGG